MNPAKALQHRSGMAEQEPGTTSITWSESALCNLQTLLQACPQSGTQPQGRLYGLIDSAADDTLYSMLMAEPQRSQVQCLFDGVPGLRYRNVAPYLLELHQASPLSLRWLEKGWRTHWGIWLCTARPTAELKAHLKKFLFVRKADRSKALFRYYDPRVMDQVLPTLTAMQCGEFFGLNHKTMPDAVFTVRPGRTGLPVSLKRYQPRSHLLLRMTGVGIYDTEDFDWRF